MDGKSAYYIFATKRLVNQTIPKWQTASALSKNRLLSWSENFTKYYRHENRSDNFVTVWYYLFVDFFFSGEARILQIVISSAFLLKQVVGMKV